MPRGTRGKIQKLGSARLGSTRPRAGSNPETMTDPTDYSLGARARDRSVQAGVLVAGVALAGGFALADVGAASTLGWVLAVPVSLSVYLVVTGSLGLCVFNGMLGRRVADHGSEPILDAAAARELRRRALAAVVLSIAVGCLSAALFVVSV